MQTTWTVGPAKGEDLPEVFALLEECDLPKEGLARCLSTTLVARKEHEIIGSAALELYQQCALLRSVAVKSAFRKQGIASSLTRAALDLAKEFHMTNVFLLTETASTFFSKQGFIQVHRSNVPENVKQSIEFTTLCPDTATVMMTTLDHLNDAPTTQNRPSFASS